METVRNEREILAASDVSNKWKVQITMSSAECHITFFPVLMFSDL